MQTNVTGEGKITSIHCTSIVPAVFQSSFVVGPKYSTKYMEYMVGTWVNIEDDRDIVYAIVDEELENLYDVSEMGI